MYSMWRPMVANPKLYVSGKISHPDHKTIDLKGWYLVLVNTESEAASKKHMLFLD